MGDYADMAIDNEMNRWLDEIDTKFDGDLEGEMLAGGEGRVSSSLKTPGSTGENVEERGDQQDDTYYHVYTLGNGLKLYAKRKVTLCQCYGGIHEEGLGCG